MLSLTPKNTRFFDLLEESGATMVRIADHLQAASQGDQPVTDVAATVLALRDANDAAFHTYTDELHEAFVTPLDRDDLYHLGFDLDRLIEAMERLANRWVTYELPATAADQTTLITPLQQTCQQIALALPLFRRRHLMSGVDKHFREIRRLARQAELNHRQALKALCQSGEEGLKAVLHKELLDLAMVAVHSCRHLADTLHKAVIRNV